MAEGYFKKNNMRDLCLEKGNALLWLWNMYLLRDNTIIVEVLPIFYIDRSSCRVEERSLHGKKRDISIVDLSPADLTEEELGNVRNALLEALEESCGMSQENAP